MVFGRSNFWGMAIWMRRGDHFWGGGGAILRRRGDRSLISIVKFCKKYMQMTANNC
jgi:hypothetical protein